MVFLGSPYALMLCKAGSKRISGASKRGLFTCTIWPSGRTYFVDVALV